MLSDWRSGSAELTPLGQSSSAIALEVGSTDEVTLLIEVVVDRGMGGGELLAQLIPTALAFDRFGIFPCGNRTYSGDVVGEEVPSVAASCHDVLVSFED